MIPQASSDGSHEELREAIRAAGESDSRRQGLGGGGVLRLLRDPRGGRPRPKASRLWKIPYGVVDDKRAQLGAKTQVQEVKSYVPVTGRDRHRGVKAK